MEAERGSTVRCESVETTGFQLQQTVLPVGSRNTEVMDRASQDSERFPLQSEVGRVSFETLSATHSAVFRKDPCRATCAQALEQTHRSSRNHTELVRQDEPYALSN